MSCDGETLNIKKRPRTKNFNTKEKEMLINLINPYKHVIENIKTDAFSIKSKNKVWEEIVTNYNTKQITGIRSVNQLKTVYDMAKRHAKKSMSDDKVFMYKIQKLFTDEEQSMVLDLVQSNRSAILRGPAFERDEAWANVVETYNLHQTSGARSADEIKYLFEHLSNTAKNANKIDKIERFKTGGGQYTKSMNGISEQVIGVIEDRITPIVNEYDDDYGYADPINIDKNVHHVQDNVEIVEFEEGVEEIDVTLDDLYHTSCTKINWDMFDSEPETSNTSSQSPAINPQNKINFSIQQNKITKDTVVKKCSTQKSVCDSLQELTKKKMNKVCKQEKFSLDIQDLKIKKAKIELETEEIHLEIAKSELATKKIEMDSKVRQMALQEEILNLQKQKLINN